MRNSLPSLFLALSLPACGDSAQRPPVSNVELEALQKAEVLRYSIEEQALEQRRLETLLGNGQETSR